MPKTAEEVAYRLVEEMVGDRSLNWGNHKRAIAAALTAARDEALEEAAIEASKFDFVGGSEERLRECRRTLRQIVTDIRALKSAKQGGR